MKVRLKTTAATLLLVSVLVAASTIVPVMAMEYRQDGTVYNPPPNPSASVSAADVPFCGPIDLALVLDNTGSMGGAIGNIKTELPTIISTANAASGGDLKVGFVTFGDTDANTPVIVHNNLTTNTSAVMDAINNTFASDGGDAAEPSDEAKNTVINNLLAGNRADVHGFVGTQVGDFNEPWRPSATKIAVLITDAPANGFGEGQLGLGLGDAMYANFIGNILPAQAMAKGILFSDVFVPTGGDYAGQAANLSADATNTGGVFITTSSDGTGTGEAITSIIEKCGAAEPTGSISGMKFNDLNGNGVNDAEPGLGGWTITLTNGTGTMTTTTAADGSYNFTDLAADTYTVAEILQAGWIQTMPSTGTYTVTITNGEVVPGQDFGNMHDVPQASCIETVNPAGKHIPTAGANPKSGQNPDGFYQLLGVDLLDPNPMVFVKDMGSGVIFGGFPSGTNIKYTEANGATPSQKSIGGPDSAVAWHITGTGDAAVYAENTFGTKSPEVSCLVPPPPK